MIYFVHFNRLQSFVYEHNLYYQESPTATPRQITSDGHPTDIFNGVPDWLYEGLNSETLVLRVTCIP